MPECRECQNVTENNYRELPDSDKCVCEPCMSMKNLDWCNECKDIFPVSDMKKNDVGNYMCDDCHDNYY